ncbi:MAG: 16S rRNA (guanine(527)-N(7))-methyltransferase RsmG [Phycisphaerae bacterium]
MNRTPDAFDSALTTALSRWALPIEPGQLDKLRAHFEAVIETNRTMNLTRITEPVASAVKHYADSLAPLLWIRERKIAVQTVLDVGTGAGFPAVPLAVMRPDWSVSAIDATGKKIEFLRRTAAALGLTNLCCEHAHSQHWKPGRSFQLVVLRALTCLPDALEQTARHVAQDGWLAAYKSAAVDRQEQDTAVALAPKLGLCSQKCYAYQLELGNEKLDRILNIYRRSPCEPSKKPVGRAF